MYKEDCTDVSIGNLAFKLFLGGRRVWTSLMKEINYYLPVVSNTTTTSKRQIKWTIHFFFCPHFWNFPCALFFFFSEVRTASNLGGNITWKGQFNYETEE